MGRSQTVEGRVGADVSRVVLELGDDKKLDLVLERLDMLLGHIVTILRKEQQIMTTEKQLQADMDAIQTGVATVLEQQTAQAAVIAALKAQLEAGTPVTQEQLDALDAEAQAIVGSLTAIAPAPPAAPPVE